MKYITIIGFCLSIISFSVNVCTWLSTDQNNVIATRTYIVIKETNERMNYIESSINKIESRIEK